MHEKHVGQGQGQDIGRKELGEYETSGVYLFYRIS
jgi:hypothetical protein